MCPDGDTLKPVGIKTAMCSNSEGTHLAKQRPERSDVPVLISANGNADLRIWRSALERPC